MTEPREDLKPLLEALILVSPEPLTAEKAKTVLEDVAVEDIQATLESLAEDWDAAAHGLRILHAGGGYLFATKSGHDAAVRKYLQIERRSKLSAAGLETLAAIAYHQPVTQAEISAIRGVDTTGTIKTLLDKKLVRIMGRKKAPGNPLVYRTSEEFLLYFGLNSLEDLPREDEIARILQDEAGGES